MEPEGMLLEPERVGTAGGDVPETAGVSPNTSMMQEGNTMVPGGTQTSAPAVAP